MGILTPSFGFNNLEKKLFFLNQFGALSMNCDKSWVCGLLLLGSVLLKNSSSSTGWEILFSHAHIVIVTTNMKNKAAWFAQMEIWFFYQIEKQLCDFQLCKGRKCARATQSYGRTLSRRSVHPSISCLIILPLTSAWRVVCRSDG